MAEIASPSSALTLSLLKSKLSEIDVLLRDNSFTTRNDQTSGDLLSTTRQAISDFIDSLTDSSVALYAKQIEYGMPNSSVDYNNFWGAVTNDLNALYAQCKQLANTISDNYNYTMSDVQNLLLQLKSVNASLGTYELYSITSEPNIKRFVENFNDISNIEVNSSLLSDNQCNIDTIEGAATLGISDEYIITQSDVNQTVISPVNGNGVSYNNTTLLQAINSNDYYLYQYEATSSTANDFTLTLDFTIVLNQAQVINHIRIVPATYGTKTWPKITALDISTDGKTLTDIRSMILGNNTTDTQFILAPYTSNYAGEGRYSFIPKQVKYIHFVIQQTSPYYDDIRELYRWAIGIKNIELSKRTYYNTSQLISKDYTVALGINQVQIDGNELPDTVFANSALQSATSISYDLSIDGGMNWKAISPVYLSGNDGNPEVIYVNSIDPSGLTTGTDHLTSTLEATSLRYRLSLSKESNNMTDTTLQPYYTPVSRNVSLKILTAEGA
jgi:hypothetical protein